MSESLSNFTIRHAGGYSMYDTQVEAENAAKIETVDENREYGVYMLISKTVPIVPDVQMVPVTVPTA